MITMCHMSEDKPRKDKVLHTRVPEVLDRELKRLADTWRVPVSNVVRAILMDAVEAADAVGERAEGELRGVADRMTAKRQQIHHQTTEALRAGVPLPSPRNRASATGGSPMSSASISSSASVSAPAPPPLAGVIGFQSLLLAKDSVCAVCGRALEVGEQAFLGITDITGRSPIVGKECLPFSHQPKA